MRRNYLISSYYSRRTRLLRTEVSTSSTGVLFCSNCWRFIKSERKQFICMFVYNFFPCVHQSMLPIFSLEVSLRTEKEICICVFCLHRFKVFSITSIILKRQQSWLRFSVLFEQVLKFWHTLVSFTCLHCICFVFGSDTVLISGIFISVSASAKNTKINVA